MSQPSTPFIARDPGARPARGARRAGAGRRARDVRAAGARQVVVGLETLPSFDALAAVGRAVGPAHVVFSLDLRDGVPVVCSGAPHHGTAVELARAAVDAGAATLLVLDL